jgi:hypothetical protein
MVMRTDYPEHALAPTARHDWQRDCLQRRRHMSIDSFGVTSELFILRDFQSKRSSSWDRTGGNRDWAVVEPGCTEVLLRESTGGCVKHIYWTYVERDERRRPNIFRGLVLRAFWDGEVKPSIEVPLGDFFGVSNGQVRPIRSLAFTATRMEWPPHTTGFNCYLPMPFERGARIEIENQGDSDARLWYHIDYQLYSERFPLPENAGRLHACWHREAETEPILPPEGQSEGKNLSGADNYEILNAQGDGQFVGCFLTVVNRQREWWGEGDDMIFIDGEEFPPSIHGTGTEEIFGGGASPKEEYSGPYAGFHCIEHRAGYDYWGTTGMYRFYITDPVRFRKSIRVTLEHGHANDKANDYSSVAFWYQREPHNPLPRLPDPASRSVMF